MHTAKSIHVSLQQVYKVCCGLSGSTDGYHRRQILYSTSTPRTSISSLPARRESTVSIQSDYEGLPQSLRLCSDTADVVVQRKNSEMNMGPRTKMTFSPILEHKGDEDDEDDGQHEETSIIDQENPIVDAGQMKKAIDQDEIPAIVDEDEKPTIFDQNKKMTKKRLPTTSNVGEDGKVAKLN